MDKKTNPSEQQTPSQQLEGRLHRFNWPISTRWLGLLTWHDVLLLISTAVVTIAASIVVFFIARAGSRSRDEIQRADIIRIEAKLDLVETKVDILTKKANGTQ